MSKRTLAHLSKKVYNTPLFVTQEGLAPIASYLSDPERTLKLMQYEQPIVEDKPLLRSDFDRDEEYRQYRLEKIGVNPETMVGTVDVKGTLVNRAGQTQACVELTSYESIKQQFTAQINEGVKTIVMQVDSHGGEAYRMGGTVNAIRKLASENDVKIIAYIDGTSASAGFGLASIADEIIANPQARVGSVGVVVQLYNDSKYLEKMGVERSFVYAGKNKIPFTEDGSFAEDFITDLQKSVDKTYKQFTNLIATNRKMTVDKVVETNAKVFDADEALSIGFVDKIMEIEDFEHYINTPSNRSNTNTISYEENMTELEKLQAQLATMQTTLTASETSLTEKTTELSDLLATKESLDTTVADLQKQLTDSQASVTKLTEQLDGIQKDAVTVDRKTKLEATLGKDNEQVPQLLASTALLDEQAFTAVVSAMSAKVEKEEKSMTEVGNSANDNAPALTYQDRLKAKAQAR